jgi:hypothetical protein
MMLSTLTLLSPDPLCVAICGQACKLCMGCLSS